MKNTILTAIAVIGLSASSVYAGEANVTLDGYVVQEKNDSAVYTLSGQADLSFDVTDSVEALVGGEVSFEDADTTNAELSEYYVGARLNGATYFTVGRQGDLWLDGTSRELDSYTLATPESGEYSLIAGHSVGMYSGAVLIGYDSDSEAVTNVQASLELSTPIAFASSVTGVVDYNRLTEDTSFGVTAEGSVSVVDTFVAATYMTDWGYEAGVGYNGLTGFVGGTEADALSHAGAGYVFAIGDVELWAETVYEIDTDDSVVGAGITFSF